MNRILQCGTLEGKKKENRGKSWDIPPFVLLLSGDESAHAPALYLQLTAVH